ncbi:MAG TPA: DUF1015 domain-containing protein [Chthonomonadaceae bacterium]|nr:DUF1015 domain-containing protein [Chthonomonadaceae bacterium]
MAQIIPFAGIHYDPARVPLDKVIAPPYDVISPAQQAALYAEHPANIVRLILNKEEAGDTEAENRYTRADAFLRESLASGVLTQDPTPALYEYVQKFEHPLEPGRIVERKTLFVALKLEPYEKGVVLPHEETHPKAKADRLNLMRATRTNPEPIYGLYEDPTLALARTLEGARGDAEPFLKAALPGKSAPDSEQHLLYRYTDPRILQNVTDFLGSRRVWIADGHHRYETGLNYRQERRETEGDPAEPKPYDYLLIGLSAFEDPGLVVLPTHRLVKNIPDARLEQLELQLERFFVVEKQTIPALRAWIKQEVVGQKRFGILTQSEGYALTLRDLQQAEAALDPSHCAAWRRLDVALLQALVLDRTLGISWTALAHTPDVAYTRDEDEAVEKVASGEFQLACLLQNPTVTEVRDVASAGDKMPQKSTFFYPKLWSGLLLRSLE